jgi:hypothetical protein
MMNTAQKTVRFAGRVFLVVLLVGSMLVSPGLADRSFGQEEKEKEGYVRTVDSSPPLAEMEKEPGWRYNSDYIFAISRAVRDSTVPPAGKVFLFIPAVPLDIVLSPFAAIAGLFGD